MGFARPGNAVLADSALVGALDGALSAPPGVGPIDLLKDAASAPNIVPGWSPPGGGGRGRVGETSPGTHALELDGPASGAFELVLSAALDAATLGAAGAPAGNVSEVRRVHNALYVPARAGFVEFDLETFGGTDERFVVRLADRVLYVLQLDAAGTT